MLDFESYYPLDSPLMNPYSKFSTDPLMYGQFDFNSDQDQYNSSCSSIQTPVTPYSSIEDELFGRISDYESSPASSPSLDETYLNENQMNNCNCNCSPYMYNNQVYYPEHKQEYTSYPTTSYCDYLSSPVIPLQEIEQLPIYSSAPVKYEEFTYPVPPIHQVMPTQRMQAPQKPLPRADVPKSYGRPSWPVHIDARSNNWGVSKECQRRFAWSQELHDQFVKAYESLGDNATPKKIMIAMRSAGANMEGITRLKVASHFQKYLQKIGRKGQPKKAGSSIPAIFPTYNVNNFQSTHSAPINVDAKHLQLSQQQKPLPVVNRPPPSA
eukprot:TRINITY_DN4201_c0_g1_i1.p1 TRINITY_DN4201_c0_g1~~TRINITY_DN4201_c0_g1_i1.p1  ORF type:complete len:325 (+),score=61.68 TRINITY_DN4201_c0_g1_i1:451-1425(+)